MRLCGAFVATMRGRDKDRATWVSSLTNEEPLVVVKACVDIMREIIREDGGNGRDGVVRKGKASLHCSGYGSVTERLFGAKNRDVGHDRGSGSHRESKVFTSG